MTTVYHLNSNLKERKVSVTYNLTEITQIWNIQRRTMATIKYGIALNTECLEVILCTDSSCIKKEIMCFNISNELGYLKLNLKVKVFPTNNIDSWDTNFYCYISPCIHYTVVNKGITGVWDASTVLSYSCFYPCLLCVRTFSHYFYCRFRLNTWCRCICIFGELFKKLFWPSKYII